MKRRLWGLFAAFVLLEGFWGGPSRAHDFYTGLVDPVTGGRCCGGYDCAPVPQGVLHSVPGGIQVIMTAEQAKLVNRSTSLPVNVFVPAERIRPSPDGQWHLCIHASDRQLPRGGVLCIMGQPFT
jgi:hypothetical protein